MPLTGAERSEMNNIMDVTSCPLCGTKVDIKVDGYRRRLWWVCPDCHEVGTPVDFRPAGTMLSCGATDLEVLDVAHDIYTTAVQARELGVVSPRVKGAAMPFLSAIAEGGEFDDAIAIAIAMETLVQMMEEMYARNWAAIKLQSSCRSL